MDQPTMEVLCKNCGQTFTAFLQEMADKNAEVLCPRCGKDPENCGPNDARPPAAHN
jgi:DNA-directed RNA polymerase subunit RPC12/RpoP